MYPHVFLIYPHVFLMFSSRILMFSARNCLYCYVFGIRHAVGTCHGMYLQTTDDGIVGPRHGVAAPQARVNCIGRVCRHQSGAYFMDYALSGLLTRLLIPSDGPHPSLINYAPFMASFRTYINPET